MSDFQNPSEEELLYQLAAAQQGGADPYSSYLGVVDPFYSQNKKIDYLNKIGNLIGIPFTQLAGVAAPEAAPAPAESTTRQVYSGNPAFQKAFDAIDAGYDPYSVTAAYVTDSKADKTIAGIDPTEFQKIAAQYATEKTKIAADTAAAGAAGGGWTMPDGSKSKNAPLGGNDIYATASEYDLMGAPSVDEALKLIGQQKGWPPRQANDPRLGAIQQGAGAGKQDPRASKLLSSLNQAAPGGQYAGQALVGKIGGAKTGSGANTSAARSLTDPFGTSLRQAVTSRLGQAQKTQVRSDANMNAMRRIIALKQMLAA